MDVIKLPFEFKFNNTVITEFDLSIPEAVALNNLEASHSNPADVTKLMKKMTIGKKLLIERCERYADLVKFHSPQDIIDNERELIEKGILDFYTAKKEYQHLFVG